MSNFQLSFMEQNDIKQSAKVLSNAMLNNPQHIGVLLGNGEKERLEIEKMFVELFVSFRQACLSHLNLLWYNVTGSQSLCVSV